MGSAPIVLSLWPPARSAAALIVVPDTRTAAAGQGTDHPPDAAISASVNTSLARCSAAIGTAITVSAPS